MKWSNLFLLTAVVSGVAPVAFADAPTATVVEGKPLTVTVQATAEATSDANAQPQRVVVLADETVDASAAPAEAKAITISVVGDGQRFVFEGNAAAGAEGKKGEAGAGGFEGHSTIHGDSPEISPVNNSYQA